MRIMITLPLCALIVIAAVIQLLLPLESRADFFKYKDDSGALIITDRLENVPKKYRNRVKVVWDADLEAKDPVAKRRTAAKELDEKQYATQKSQQEVAEKKKASKKEKILVIELDEKTGQVIRRFE